MKMELKQFKAVVLPLRGRLLRYAQKLTEDVSDAEDVVQETMIKLWNMRDKLNEYNSIEALAMKMTHNLCIDICRKKRSDNYTLELFPALNEIQTPEKLLEAKDEISLMKTIIDSLPPLQSMIIRMKDIEGYETHEIMEITGCNNEAIRSNLSRARKKVRDIYLQSVKERRTRI